MAKPTTEELQTELQEVINKYNQAKTTAQQCEKRFTELSAIINDRTTPETEETT